MRYSSPRCSYSSFTSNAASRNLWDHENREVYESSHSVVLALLAAHAQRAGDGSDTASTTKMDPNMSLRGKGKGKATAVARPLTEKIVPFYTNCLLEVRPSLRYRVPWLTQLCHFPCVFHPRILLKVGLSVPNCESPLRRLFGAQDPAALRRVIPWLGSAFNHFLISSRLSHPTRTLQRKAMLNVRIDSG